MKKWIKIILLIVLVVGAIPYKYGYITDGDFYCRAIVWDFWHLRGGKVNTWVFSILGGNPRVIIPIIQIKHGW